MSKECLNVSFRHLAKKLFNISQNKIKQYDYII